MFALIAQVSPLVSRYFPVSFETLGVYVSASVCVIQDVTVYICVFTADVRSKCCWILFCI